MKHIKTFEDFVNENKVNEVRSSDDRQGLIDDLALSLVEHIEKIIDFKQFNKLVKPDNIKKVIHNMCFALVQDSKKFTKEEHQLYRSSDADVDSYVYNYVIEIK